MSSQLLTPILSRPPTLLEPISGKCRDHVRLVFPKPITVTVMREKVEVWELVFRRPLNTGVFWVRTGDKWRRYSKYEPQKEQPFVAWLRQAQPAD